MNNTLGSSGAMPYLARFTGQHLAAVYRWLPVAEAGRTAARFFELLSG